MAANESDFTFEEPEPVRRRLPYARDRIRRIGYENPGKWFRLNRVYSSNTIVHSLRRALGGKFEVKAQPVNLDAPDLRVAMVREWHAFVRFLGTEEEAKERLRILEAAGSLEDE